jgi:hypothetical protein
MMTLEKTTQRGQKEPLVVHNSRPLSSNKFYEVKITRETSSNLQTALDVLTLQNGSESLSPLPRRLAKQEVFEIFPVPVAGASINTHSEANELV